MLQSSSVDEELEPPSVGSVLTSAIHQKKIQRNDVYAEWDTMETIHHIRLALSTRHHVTLIEANADAFEMLRTTSPQIVFNIAEGLNGVSREAHIPSILEFLQIPYTGSDPLALATCLDKSRTKEILSYHNIPTPSFIVIENLEQILGNTFSYPCFVKPLHEGSSKGIYNSCVVRDKNELYQEVTTILSVYNEPVLVEKYLPGREFTVAMLGNGDDARVLPIVEIKFDALPEGVNPIYSFEAKWIWDTAANPLEIFQCPASLSPLLQQQIEKVCLQAYSVLRIRDWCRIDVRLDENGIPNIIELNPLPGILPHPEDNSCYPKAARAAGISYDDLLCRVLETAAVRVGLLPNNGVK